MFILRKCHFRHILKSFFPALSKTYVKNKYSGWQLVSRRVTGGVLTRVRTLTVTAGKGMLLVLGPHGAAPRPTAHGTARDPGELPRLSVKIGTNCLFAPIRTGEELEEAPCPRLARCLLSLDWRGILQVR